MPTIRRQAQALSLAVSFVAALSPACMGDIVAPSAASQGQQCGTVDVRGPNPPTDASAAQAERCILAAYTGCQAASLTLVTHGVDLTSTTTFIIQSGSPCRVTGTVQTVLVPATRTTSSFTSARLVPKDDGVLFVGCGQAGDIFIPPPRS